MCFRGLSTANPIHSNQPGAMMRQQNKIAAATIILKTKLSFYFTPTTPIERKKARKKSQSRWNTINDRNSSDSKKINWMNQWCGGSLAHSHTFTSAILHEWTLWFLLRAILLAMPKTMLLMIMKVFHIFNHFAGLFPRVTYTYRPLMPQCGFIVFD